MRVKTLKLKKNQSVLPLELLHEDFTHLEIFGGSLESIPAALFTKQNLKSLKIKNANLVELPDAIGESASQIESLSLGHNGLRTLPDWLHQLTSLKMLDLGSNEITELPEKLPLKIERMNLEGNKLVTLPDSLFSLKSLLHLNLDGNPLNEATLQRVFEAFGIWCGD